MEDMLVEIRQGSGNQEGGLRMLMFGKPGSGKVGSSRGPDWSYH